MRGLTAGDRVIVLFKSSGGSRICKRGAKVERRKREYRGAEDAEGVGCGEGALPLPQKMFLTLDLKMSTSSAF